MIPSSFSPAQVSTLRFTLALVAAASAFSLFSPIPAHAANANWIGGTGTQAWNSPGNWNPGIPGLTTGTTNADIATFNTSTTGTLITIDPGRNLSGLAFATGAAGTYTIGSAGANQGPALHLSSGGSILMNLGVTSPVVINAPLILEPTSALGPGSYTFANNSASADADPNTYKMIINGGISGGTTTGAITLNLGGSAGNRSNDGSGNVITGLISNGSAASLSLNVAALSNQRGVWRIENNNNSFTGNVAVNTGTLLFTSIANAGQNSALGAGAAITLGSGVHFKYVGTGNHTTNRTITGSGAFYNSSGGTTLTLTAAVSSGLTFRGGGNFDIQGLVTGTSGLSRTDGGTVTLSNNNNSFTGDVTISDGAFRVATISMNGTNSAIGNTNRIVLGQGSTTIGRLEYTGITTTTNRLIVMRNEAATGGRGVIDVVTAGETLTFNSSSGVRVNTNTATNVGELTLRGAGNGVMEGVIGGSTSNAAFVAGLKLIKEGTGTWTLKGANTYARETTVSAGILNVQHNSALGAVISNDASPDAIKAGTTVASGATLQLQNNIAVGAEALTLSGTGATGQSGALVNVSGNNSFAGALTLAGNTTIASDSGRLDLTNSAAIAGASRAVTLAGAGNGSLAAPLLAANISTLTKNGSGLWTVSGAANTYTGATTVNGGILNVTGTLDNTAVTVNNTGTFAHTGTLVGNVTIANGGSLLVGNAEVAGSTGTLNIGGNLLLNQNSMLLMNLGTNADLINVSGALTLDGIVSVTPGAGFAAGTHRLINYTAGFTNNALTAQVIAGYDLAVDTTTANQVNLVATAITAAQYWDGSNTTANGTVDGGNGIWTNANTNWTTADGSANNSWASATEKIAIFTGATGGTVQVQDIISINGLQFGNNYNLTNAGSGQLSITNAATEVRVNGSITADISAPITGAGGIDKTGDGTLTLSGSAGTHTYTGATRISSGILKAGADNALPTGTAVTVGGNVSAVGVTTTSATFDLSIAGQQVSSLTLTGNNTALSSNVIIGAGKTLTITGPGGLTTGVANSAKNTTIANFTGGGNLVINNTAANIQLGLQTATAEIPGMTLPFDSGANRNTTVTDFTQLSSFTAIVNEFRVAQGVNNVSTVNLSNTANAITAEVIQVSNSAGLNSGAGVINLGAGTNVIAADLINIGVSKGDGTIKFASQTAGSPGSVVIGGKDSAEVDFLIGASLGTNTAFVQLGHLNLTGHQATVVADSVALGQRDAGGSGGATGTISFSQGTFTANSLNMGSMAGNATGTANGVLNLSGGTFTVNNSLTLATFGNSAAATGKAQATLNLTGGTLISKVDILEGGGANSDTTNTVSTITLNGGTLDLTGHAIGSATNTINVLTLAAGALKDVSQINGGADIEKTTTGVLSLLGTNTYTGKTTITAGTLQVGNGGDNGTLGSGDVVNAATLALNRNNLVNISNNISGAGVVNQIGTGTSVLSGVNTYSGVTTVTAGTLLANNDYSGANSATGTNAVNVNTGGTFGGRGRIDGNVTVNSGSFFAPGGNAATTAANLTGLSGDIGTVHLLGHLNLNSGATMAIQLKTNGAHGLTPTFNPVTNRLTGVTGTSLDGGNDRAIVDGNLVLASDSILSITFGTGYVPSYQDVFDLLDWTGSAIALAYYGDATGKRLGGTADNSLYALKLPDLSIYNSEWFWDVSQFGNTGVVAIVPEPSRILLLAFALLGFTLRRRR